MKKVLTVVLSLLLIGCDLSFLDDIKYDDTYLGLPVVKTIMEAWRVAGAVQYVSDPVMNDLWKEPRDTYRDMTGDCEDICALFIAIVINSGLGSGNIVGIALDGSTSYHAVAEINGLLYEAQFPGMFYSPSTIIMCRYSFEEYLAHKSLNRRSP